MVGLIQKILFDLIDETAGPGAIAEVRRRANVPLDKVFRIGEVYSDQECQRLFDSAREVLELSEQEVEAAYADQFCRDAIKRFPVWFNTSPNSRKLLERQVTIHNVFASGVRDHEARKAVQDKFHIDLMPQKIITHYRSPNRLCGLYVALARWVIGHYGDEAEIVHARCMKKGDPECEMHVTWTKLKNH